MLGNRLPNVFIQDSKAGGGLFAEQIKRLHQAPLQPARCRFPPSPLEECDACDGKSRREGTDLASEDTAGRAVMNDTSSCWREDIRLPVGEPYGRMAVQCPAWRVGNGQGDNTRRAGKNPVIDEVKETDPAVVACLLGGRPDREEVE